MIPRLTPEKATEVSKTLKVGQIVAISEYPGQEAYGIIVEIKPPFHFSVYQGWSIIPRTTLHYVEDLKPLKKDEKPLVQFQQRDSVKNKIEKCREELAYWEALQATMADLIGEC